MLEIHHSGQEPYTVNGLTQSCISTCPVSRRCIHTPGSDTILHTLHTMAQSSNLSTFDTTDTSVIVPAHVSSAPSAWQGPGKGRPCVLISDLIIGSATCSDPLSCAPTFDRLVGLVVRRPPREWKVPGSNPACAGIFSGLSHTSDLKIGTPVATLPGAWRYRVSAGTGRPGVSIL